MFLSIVGIFRVGIGPSSAHTMGPMTAAARFLDDLRNGREKEPGAGDLGGLGCSLHGSLAFTGKGHATDRAVILGFAGFEPATLDPDRAEVADWLSAHGWRAQRVESKHEMRRLNRLVEIVDADEDSFSAFTTAERV